MGKEGLTRKNQKRFPFTKERGTRRKALSLKKQKPAREHCGRKIKSTV